MKIEIYGRDDCRYCAAAKALCDKRGYRYVYHDINSSAAVRAEMEERAPAGEELTTVPQIFIGAHHIGGFDEFSALEHVVMQIIGGE